MNSVPKSCKTRQLFHYIVVIVLLVFVGCSTSVNLCCNKIYIIGFLSLFNITPIYTGNISVTWKM